MNGGRDEVDTVGAVDGTNLQGNNYQYSSKPNGAHTMESQKMIIPDRGEFLGAGIPPNSTLLDKKNLEIGEAHPYSGVQYIVDDGDMVEELTLQRMNGDDIAVQGTSSNGEILQTRQSQWQHLSQTEGGIGSSSSVGEVAHGDHSKVVSNGRQGLEHVGSPECSGQKPTSESYNDSLDNGKTVANNQLKPFGGIRTKIISKSGFSNYFLKSALKEKGVICKSVPHEGSGVDNRGLDNCKAVSNALEIQHKAQGSDNRRKGGDDVRNLNSAASTVAVALNPPVSSSTKTDFSPSQCVAKAVPDSSSSGGVSMREWLRTRHSKANKIESLYIFRNIVNLVDSSHSQGTVLQDLRPSCFNLLPSNQVVYLGSSLQLESVGLADQGNYLSGKRSLEHSMRPSVRQQTKKPRFGNNTSLNRHQPSLGFGSKSAGAYGDNVAGTGPQDSKNEWNKEYNHEKECNSLCNSSSPHVSSAPQQLSASATNTLEDKWYSSPEELSGRECTISSNIYALGIFLFELLGSFGSEMELAAAMSDLRYRILPPNFLSENPKEAGFCLWLLHPEPSSRPAAREVLQSDVISGIEESFGDELSSSINQDDEESELLLHFLHSLKAQKQKDASKLFVEIKCLEADLNEIDQRQRKSPSAIPRSSKEAFQSKESRFLPKEQSSSEIHSKSNSTSGSEYRLLNNISLLESAYFSTRSNIQLPDKDTATRTNTEVLSDRGNQSQLQRSGENKSLDPLGAFFTGLCKYARHSKFEVRGLLRNGEFNNSTSVICSLSFDRDQDYFATAGVSKKIKIYEFQPLVDDTVDIQYPVIEMSNKSKLSWICWNSYIRNYLASTDYDGIVKLWDAGTGQEVSQYSEHNKRTWSVDFSPVDPTKLASGSDDFSVKVWNINERKSVCTVRNIANVCSVQFSSHSSHLIAFGSADYKTYCYDLRNVSSPWCVLAGHDRTVSYVKFLDADTIVSASTDNTLKVWDLNKTSSNSLSTTACSLTLKGHTNEKNFVGLSVHDGYIACGSETNEVYAYHKSLPMPITSHKFGSINSITGKETDDDGGQFVSSVCWRKKSDMLVAANSTGSIKVLQMV